MHDLITDELNRLEKQHDIKILYAVESGSRAWGFPSTDSDWDVRYIYIHRLDWYLMIDGQRDTLEAMLPNGIDLAGWELKKTLRLFRKSNPPLLEWLRSPIIYSERFSLAGRLRLLLNEFFNPKSCIYHYLHMAERNFREYLHRDIVIAKKYFYVLRPILACDWIHRTKEMAPMEFDTLLDTLVTDPVLKKEILTLLERKIKGEELSREPKNHIINAFIEEKILFYNNYVKSLDKSKLPDTGKLNELFRLTLQESWENDAGR